MDKSFILSADREGVALTRQSQRKLSRWCHCPNCGFCTAHHPIHPELRNKRYEYAYPIHVGSDVWISGTVVVPDIPDNCVAVGNLCKRVREITEEDLRQMR